MAKSKTHLADKLSFVKEMAYLQENAVFLSSKDGYMSHQSRVMFSFLGMKDDFTKDLHHISNTTQRVFSKEDFVSETYYIDDLDFVAFRQIVIDMYSLAVMGKLGRWFNINRYNTEEGAVELLHNHKLSKAAEVFPNEIVRDLVSWIINEELKLRDNEGSSELELGYQVLYLWREFLKMLEQQKQEHGGQGEQGGGSSMQSIDYQEPSGGSGESQDSSDKSQSDSQGNSNSKTDSESESESEEQKDKEQEKDGDKDTEGEQESQKEHEENREEPDNKSDADKDKENEGDSDVGSKQEEQDRSIDQEPDVVGGKEKGTEHLNPTGPNKFDVEKWKKFLLGLEDNYKTDSKVRTAARQGLNKREQIRLDPQIGAAIKQFCKQIRNRETSKVRTVESQVGLKFNTFRAVQFLATKNPIVKCFDKTSVARTTAIDLVFGLDVSGSMGNNTGNKEKLVSSLISTINSSLVKHVKIFATNTVTESVYDSRDSQTKSLNMKIAKAMTKMRGGGGTDLATCIPHVLDYCNPRTRTEFVMITDGYDNDIQNLILKLGEMTKKNYFLRAHMVIVNDGYNSAIMEDLPGIVKRLSTKDKFEIVDARFIKSESNREWAEQNSNDLMKEVNKAFKRLNI